MCVAIFKRRNKSLPSRSDLKKCFEANPDGGGFAVAKEGKLIINKGYFEFNKFWDAIKESIKPEDPALIHCRIATSGRKDGGACHPFPITDNVKDLRAKQIVLEGNDFAVIHNGIIPINRPKKILSDTQEFIRSILSSPEIKESIYTSKPIQKLLTGYLGSGKAAFLRGDGKGLRHGEFKKIGECLYSNDYWTYSRRAIVRETEDTIFSIFRGGEGFSGRDFIPWGGGQYHRKCDKCHSQNKISLYADEVYFTTLCPSCHGFFFPKLEKVSS